MHIFPSRQARRSALIALAMVALVSAAASAATEITRSAVLSKINAYRLAEGLPPLEEDQRLVAAAEDRMRDMEEQSYWAHESPDGRSPFVWLTARGYNHRSAGENLAAGFETTEVLVASWMESRGHRDNILSPDYADCGIAIIDGSTLGRAVGKSVVVLFGRSR